MGASGFKSGAGIWFSREQRWTSCLLSLLLENVKTTTELKIAAKMLPGVIKTNFVPAS